MLRGDTKPVFALPGIGAPPAATGYVHLPLNPKADV
jgi:hypothetical protein